MGKKDKKKKKGTPFGYLVMLVGLLLAAVGVTLGFQIEQAVEIAESVPVLQDQLDESPVLFGMLGAGVVLFFIGIMIRPRKAKKK